MPPLYLAEFSDLPDVLVHADDNVMAEKAMQAAGIAATPTLLVVIPSGVFVAEVLPVEVDEDDTSEESEEGDGWELRPFQAFEVLLDQRQALRPLLTPDEIETKPELGDANDG